VTVWVGPTQYEEKNRANAVQTHGQGRGGGSQPGKRVKGLGEETSSGAARGGCVDLGGGSG